MQQVLPSGADGRERADLLTEEDQEEGWAVRFPCSGAAIHDRLAELPCVRSHLNDVSRNCAA